MSKKRISTRATKLLFDRSKQLKGNGRDAPKVAPYFPGVLLETEEFQEIFLSDSDQTEFYEEDSDNELNPTWSDSDCSDNEFDQDMETETSTEEPRVFGRPKKVLTKEDLEKDHQTLKLVS